jgi:hypothetical protein
MQRRTERLLARLRQADPTHGEPPDGAPLDNTGQQLLSRILAEPSAVAERPNTRRRLALVAFALIAGGAIGAGATSLALAGTSGESGAGPPATPAELSSVSTKGTPVKLASKGRFDELFRPTGVFLLAVRGDRAFFHVDSATHSGCFGEGPAMQVAADTYQLGLVECGGQFPSVSVPVLDQSVMEVSRAHGFRVMRIQGFAADGVATVAATDVHGSVLAETAVADNVYKLTAYAPGQVAELVARDPSGRVVYTVPLGPRPPLPVRRR